MTRDEALTELYEISDPQGWGTEGDPLSLAERLREIYTALVAAPQAVLPLVSHEGYVAPYREGPITQERIALDRPNEEGRVSLDILLAPYVGCPITIIIDTDNDAKLERLRREEAPKYSPHRRWGNG